ncbi:MFS transporter [Anoxybacillus rupiensis]|jgi:MFS transporter, YQGE family, putative transporter|uniref:MFS transporter n=1 Tax=Anoxybacteroides rupiense TaxID=311460 RepID=A0ABT5W609_9BACL|nr:MFS transporter [Anoxybacillus rupiensis]MDE8564766.1 MFS transporter [Anoxybacillus rupiensis]
MKGFLRDVSPEATYYLAMTGLFSFGNALSGMFLQIFIWRLDRTFTLLAQYSFYTSLFILCSFYFCAWLARKTSPMATMRWGIAGYFLSYLLALVLRDALIYHLLLLGMLQGLAISLFSVGMHMANLDMATNRGRDRFLYMQGLMTAIGGVAGPLVSGAVISWFDQMLGFYLVFFMACVFFGLAAIVSLRIPERPVELQSRLLAVLLHAPKEWKRMYLVMLGDGIASGVYVTFLISMMMYQVAGGEWKLGVFQMMSELVSIASLAILARRSRPDQRMLVYTIGTLGIWLGSLFLAYQPTMLSLMWFVLMKPISLNMMNTTMNALIYAAIEKDPCYKQMQLDYITVREIPLGLGRMAGVFIFFMMRNYLDFDRLLPVSFSLFPLIYVGMIPVLYLIWHKNQTEAGRTLT